MEFSKNEIFIVTGASSGLGLAVAHLLNKNGATVIAIARNESRLITAQEESLYPQSFHIEVKDLSQDIGLLPKYINSLKNKYGKFSGLANCAGISKSMPLQGLELEDLEHMFQINYFSPIMLTKGLCDKRNNIGKGTSICSISSYAAQVNPVGLLNYTGAKSALTASMKVLSKEIITSGIRINTVSPGLVNTPMSQAGISQGEPDVVRLAESYPYGMGEASDVANLVVFLLSKSSKWITGQDYVINYGSV